MGLIDTIKGMFSGTGIQSALESTGLADHIETLSGQGSGVVDALGADLGASADALGGLGADIPDVGGIADSITNPT